MGISIHLNISKSVTQEEWEQVYNETLCLVEKFPLAEKRKVPVHGIDTFCMVSTKEREETYLYPKKKTVRLWSAIGDLDTLKTAEEYSLPRELVDESSYEPDAGDALLGALPAYMSYAWDHDRFNHVYEMWGAKTQGEPYHLYLLAIAALIEARLGRKAFIYGDITRGQFKRAVELANQHLTVPIDVPDRCDMERFFSRVKELPLPDEEKPLIFERFYLGTKDGEYAEFFRNMFDPDVMGKYWKHRFENSIICTIGFDNVLKDYLSWGFDLEKLCTYVQFQDKDGNYRYEAFVKDIMDAKMHLKDKNCEDMLEIDQEEERPYTVATLFAQFVFAGAKNKKVDRYMPLEEIRKSLVSALGDQCDVNRIIDEYLEEEAEQMRDVLAKKDETEEKLLTTVSQDISDTFNQIMNVQRQQLIDERKEYDLVDCEDLMYYETGDTMHPCLLKSLAHNKRFLDSILEETEFKYLMRQDADRRYKWMVDKNEYILLRDTDWEKVYTDVKDHHAFGRYYPLFRVKMSNHNIVEMCRALMINDDLYNYSIELAETFQEDES